MPATISEAVIGPKGTRSDLLEFLAEAAFLWHYRGQHEKAITIFQALALLAPSDPCAHLGMATAYISLQKFREADKAADLASRSERIDRRSLACAYSLKGMALFQLKKPREAEKALTRAAEMDEGGAEGKAALEMMDVAKKMGLLVADTTPKKP